VLNTPGIPDGSFRLEVDGEVAIDLTEVFYRDLPSYPDRDFTPAGTILGYHSNSEFDCDGGLSGSLQGGLSRSGIEQETDRAQLSSTTQAPDDGISDHRPVGFKGIFFRYAFLLYLCLVRTPDTFMIDLQYVLWRTPK
jgi:hypothetical protein